MIPNSIVASRGISKSSGMIFNVFLLFMYASYFDTSHGLPDEGKWDCNLTAEYNNVVLSKSLYKDSKIAISVNCETPVHNSTITINVVVVPSPCWDFTDAITEAKRILRENQVPSNLSKVQVITNTYPCNDHIALDAEIPVVGKKASNAVDSAKSSDRSVYVTSHDGVYVLVFRVNMNNSTDFNIGVHIEMKGDYGYLSAADWPLLSFYGFMCLYYILLGLVWLTLSFLQWRDLLRVQFWIGAVILLGMLEKAAFYAEYHSINTVGVQIQGLMLFAEWVSCAKRTLARMLVVIVSLGFGIVKPRLGSTLHRVVGVGLLYFFLAASEGYMRITKAKNETSSKDLLVASVPLAVLDSAICWWIFSALVNTTRTLRLRRNEIKLSLYRHFTNTLIFSVVASVFFMFYSIKAHRFVNCLTLWKDLWLEESFWHILFSALLTVIMILWRPTNNNQRYAFVPLLDTGDDEEEEQLVSDAYGVKVRVHHPRSTPPRNNTIEDDLKWLDENVQSDPALPILDSDEELVNTRFEVSKMQ